MSDAQADEQLLRTFAAGRTAALGELARRYETALLGLARGVLGGDTELARGAVLLESWDTVRARVERRLRRRP